MLQKSVATATTIVSISACTPERKEGFETSWCVMQVFEFLLSCDLSKLGQGNLKGPARAWDFFKGGQWVDNLNTPVSTILCRTPIFFYIKHNSHLVTYDLDLRPPPIIPAPINQSQLLRTHQPTLPIPNPFRALLNVSRNHALGGGKS